MKRLCACAVLTLGFTLAICFVGVSTADQGQDLGKQRVIFENFTTGEYQIVETIQNEPERLETLSAIGQKRLAVLLINFTDDTSRPVSREEAQQAMFGSAPDSLASRVSRHSYGRLNLLGDVFDWITIPPPTDQKGQVLTGCDKGYSSVVAAKKAAGVDGRYDHYMLVVPAPPDCHFGGVAAVIGDYIVMYGNVGTTTAEHEIGHNFGFQHSRYDDYPASGKIAIEGCPMYDPANPKPCEYGDFGEAMGIGLDGYAAYNRFKIGWLDLTDTTTVTSDNSDTTLVLSSLESSGGLRDIAVALEDGSEYSYHIQYSSADTRLPGLTVRLNKPNRKDSTGRDVESFYSYLVPAGSDHFNHQAAALPLGQTFTDTVNGVAVSLLSQDSFGATVRVRLIPVMTSLSYPEGGKKLVVRGVHFGPGVRVVIDGHDISDQVNWPVREDTVGKAKGGAIRQAFAASGNHTVQLLTANGTASNVITVVTP